MTIDLTLPILISLAVLVVTTVTFLSTRARQQAQDTQATTHALQVQLDALDARQRGFERHQVVAEEFMRARYQVLDRLTRLETQVAYQQEVLSLLREDMPKVLHDMLAGESYGRPRTRETR
jgi:hypothetical protein